MALATLSGADYFHLLIDKKMKRYGMAGNISRVHFELEEATDLNALEQRIVDNKHFQQVCAVRYKFRSPLFPVWVKTNETARNVEVSEGLSTEDLNAIIIKRIVDNNIGLIWVDLCALKDGAKHLVVSMHHALFDHQGMMNFIHALNDNFDGPLFRKSEPTSWLRVLANGAVMNFDLFRRSVWKFGSLFQGKIPSRITPTYHVLRFSYSEKQIMTQNAWQNGARIGESTFHLAVIAQALQQLFLKRRQASPNLWFSVPHDQRKLGSQGHMLSNKLSFLFFNLTDEKLRSTKNSVTAVMNQLKVQIKFRAVDKYVDMMKVMRLVPMPIYSVMVSVPSKGKLSSFGYSDLGKDKLNMPSIAGAKIKNVLRYPPVPSPPGFNVAALRKHDGFELTIAYGKELMSETEAEELIANIKDGLLNERS